MGFYVVDTAAAAARTERRCRAIEFVINILVRRLVVAIMSVAPRGVDESVISIGCEVKQLTRGATHGKAGSLRSRGRSGHVGARK